MKKISLIALSILLILFTLTACDKKIARKIYENTEVVNEKIVHGFLYANGKPVTDKYYDEIIRGFDGDYAVCKDNGKLIIINKKGEVLNDENYTNVIDIKDDRAIVIKDNRYYIYDLKNKLELFGGYNYIKMKTDDYYACLDGDKWYYVAEDGSTIKPKNAEGYEEAFQFKDNNAIVKQSDGVYIIDKEGNENKLIYNSVVQIDNTDYFLASEPKGAILDGSGKVLFDELPGGVIEVKDDLVVIYERNDSLINMAIYDINGNLVVEPVHEEVRILNKDYFVTVDTKSDNKEEKYEIYTMDNVKLNKEKYSYVDGSNMKENGGYISAILHNRPVFIDKEGKIEELEGLSFDEDIISVDRDKNFIIVETKSQKSFIKDGKIEFQIAKIDTIDDIKYSYITEENKIYPFFTDERINPAINESIKSNINILTDEKIKEYNMSLSGDILNIEIITDDMTIPFMVNIASGSVVTLDSIFKVSKLIDYLSDDIEKDSLNYKLLTEKNAFILGERLKVITEENGSYTLKEYPIDDVIDFIKDLNSEFFRAQVAPKINGK